MTFDPAYAIPMRRPLPERVIRAFLPESWLFLLVFIAVLGPAVYWIRRIPPIYQARSELLIESPRSVERLVSGGNNSGVSQLDTVGDRVNPINNQIALIRSTPIFLQALEKAGLDPQGIPHGGLGVKLMSGTDLVEITYAATDPELPPKIVAAITEVYVQENLRLNREKASQARRALEQQLPKLQEDLRNAQDALETFQQENRFLGGASETAEVTRTLNDVRQRVQAAQVELSSTVQRLESLQGQLPEDPNSALRVVGLSRDPNFQALRADLVKAETELAQLQSRYTDQNPQVLSALDKRDRLAALLRDYAIRALGEQAGFDLSIPDPVQQGLVEKWFELGVERAAQNARLGQLNSQLAEIQSRYDALPELVKEHTHLQLALDRARQTYMIFSENLTSSRLLEQQSLGNVRVIEPPSQRSIPIGPNRKPLYAVALVLGTLTGLGAVWTKVATNNKLRTLPDLRDILPLPILSAVPWGGVEKLAELASGKENPLLDGYQTLQAQMRMLPREVHTIAIASWSRPEGSGLVAENLALLEAQIRRRVLLVRANTSEVGSPHLSRFDATTLEERDLKDPAEEERQWKEWLQTQKAEHPNGAKSTVDLRGFDVLIYQVGLSLSAYKKWSMLLERLRKRYDLVILDCPPVSQGSAATLLASLCDGVLWVVAPQQLGRRGAAAAAETLRTWDSRLLGQVVVGADLRPLSKGQPQLGRSKSLGLLPEGG